MKDQIKALRKEAEQHGDLRMAMICVLALGGVSALLDCDPGSEAHTLLVEGKTRDWARGECLRVLRAAQAMESS